MDRIEYLLQLTEDEILNHWSALGEMKITSKNKMYSKDSIVRVDCSELGNGGPSSSALHNVILYVAENYIVDNIRKPQIDWTAMNIDDVTGQYVAIDGIQSPYFVVLPAKWNATFVPDPQFLPYQESEGVVVNNGGIIISDDEMELLLVDIGFPFLTFQDVEFSKNEIQRVCIKPAMQRFYTFFPIIEEEAGSNYSRGSEFLIPYPENAYRCVPYYSVPGGVSASQASNNPFTYYNELQMTGATGMGGKFGRGLHYHGKLTPGYVGMEWRNTQLDRLATSQAFLNYFRREKCSRKIIDGKLYAYGFTSVGGNLNFKWLKWDPDWNMIPFELLENVARPMCKSAILQQFGMLRTLVKTDIAGQIDSTVLTNERKTIEDNLKPILNSIATSGVLALQRGGG
jgi:hypothetical protein